MNNADKILSFYQSLASPSQLPKSIETLNPYQTEQGWEATQNFYTKYYSDHKTRHILFGINPGRFGGGITGIPFTDPVVLQQSCGIENPFHKRTELSSQFIYEVIHAFGSPEEFFNRFYITGMSPLGFVENGKNLNYYDVKNWKSIFKKDVVKWIKQQLDFSVSTDKAYSIGKGQNLKFLETINSEFKFFSEIIPLPHPRWVMQYRTKRKQEFIDEYIQKLR